jgi:hypothetical protein
MINPNLKPLLDNLDIMAKLEPNWNGEGAEAIEQDNIDTARDILNKLANANIDLTEWRAMPLAQGGVCLDWANYDGDSIQITIEHSLIEMEHHEIKNAFSNQEAVEMAQNWFRRD